MTACVCTSRPEVLYYYDCLCAHTQAQKHGYSEHKLGPKEAEAQKREWTEEELRSGRNIIGLQMGTNQVASQQGMTPYGKQRQIYQS